MPPPNTPSNPWTDPPTPPRTATSNVLARTGSLALGGAGVAFIAMGSVGLGVGLSVAGLALNAADLAMGLQVSNVASKEREAAADASGTAGTAGVVGAEGAIR